MGTCGCNEIPNAKGYRIGDKVLIVEVYPGCELCHTGIAVTLYLFTQKEANDYYIELEDFPIDQLDNRMLIVPVLDLDNLCTDGLPDFEHYGCLNDWLSDNGRELVQNAVYKEINKWTQCPDAVEPTP